MPGLRQKKKLRTQKQIIDAAEHLFMKNGYEGASIEDIAERAEVGVGTVYNYFGSKKQLLVAIIARETEDVIKQGESILDNPLDDPADTFSAIFDIYLQCFLKFDKPLMREIFAASIAEPDTLGQDLYRLDLQLVEQLVVLIEKMKSAGSLNQDIPSDKAAMILYSMLGMQMIVYLEFEDMKPATVKKDIRQNMSIILSNWYPG